MSGDLNSLTVKQVFMMSRQLGCQVRLSRSLGPSYGTECLQAAYIVCVTLSTAFFFLLFMVSRYLQS